MRSRRFGSSLLPLFAAIGIAGCSSAPVPPAKAEIRNEVAAAATVRAVDPLTRQITFEAEDGEVTTVVAGPEVRNFDRIAVGNTIRLSYIESLSARRLAPEELAAEPVAAVAAGRAERGAMPAAGIGAGVALTVRVESVDRSQHLVVFTDPDGRLRTVRAQRDEGKAFVAGLKTGDRVELVYGQAMLLRVE